MSLSVTVGPMFSGKTTRLLKKLTRIADTQNVRPLLINHAIDDRDAKHVISSHASSYKGLSPKITVVSTSQLSDVDVDGYVVIGVDEISFFPDLYETLRKWMFEGKHLVCAGLDSTAQMEPFGEVHRLVSLSKNFKKLNAECSKCREEKTAGGKLVNPHKSFPAPYTAKISGDEQKVIDIGAADKYIATCLKHHPIYLRQHDIRDPLPSESFDLTDSVESVVLQTTELSATNLETLLREVDRKGRAGC